MKIDIPDIGSCEVNNLPNEYYYDAIHNENYNFVWTTVNGHKCIICSDTNMIAMAQYVLDDEPFASAVTDYQMEKGFQGMGYWYFLATECESDFEGYSDIWCLFDYLVEEGIIKRIPIQTNETDGDCVYVLPDYDKFDLNNYKEVRLELGRIAFSVLEELKLRAAGEEYEDVEDLDDEKYRKLEKFYKHYLVDIKKIKEEESELDEDELEKKYGQLLDDDGYIDYQYLEDRNWIMEEIGKIVENK